MDMNPNDMSCKELVELVTDYLEGALSPADRQRFDLHIGKCDWCKLYVDQIRLTIQAAGNSPKIPSILARRMSSSPSSATGKTANSSAVRRGAPSFCLFEIRNLSRVLFSLSSGSDNEPKSMVGTNRPFVAN